MTGYSQPRTYQRLQDIPRSLHRLFALSREQGIPTSQATDELAERRIRGLRELQSIYLPPSPQAR